MTYLEENYFSQHSALHLAPKLLGKIIERKHEGQWLKAEITEVEAYLAQNDRACHAYNNRRTPRTEIMFQLGGKLYMYLCYGIHELCNITCNSMDVPEAILIRAATIIEGEDLIQKLRPKKKGGELLSGPGNLSKGLALSRKDYGKSILSLDFRILDMPDVKAAEIHACPRIGVDYAGEDALLPYRFYLRDRSSVSKK
ncbi:DNA-3-methyladenine glycosylase [Croceimicrobium hydrocarbonivorans]|uniref:Putative 3-methyladenine DNA glycosylase n=1 Tax=Croceimicrobium hydrocarbonivorans TaxID=2761580 RepID=A0A7H0VJE5_9FLAO|nr:DNA-3-methyladenine glycosylase [Croceimicrobium hydrocarbonivorans]QNR25843.1 DNA-3-methyladenine glycosylase [Croceimicrobium hydrocarbonivorans]